MKKAFRTDVVRSITHSLSRFFAILMIVALGTGFLHRTSLYLTGYEADCGRLL